LPNGDYLPIQRRWGSVLKGKDSLKNLAQAFATGKINAGLYRHQRTILLENITNDRIVIRPASCFNIKLQTVGTALKNTRVYIILPVTLAFLLLVGILRLSPSTEIDGTHSPEVSKGNEEQEISEKVIPSSRLAPEQFVHSFVTKTDWSEEAVSQLKRQWETLPPAELEKARKTAWFSDFAEALLLYLDNQKSRAERYQLDANYSYLQEMAEYLGIITPETENM
jgi:hypothetical protein